MTGQANLAEISDFPVYILPDMTEEEENFVLQGLALGKIDFKDDLTFECKIYTAYKRVDKKVKPVPGTFPEGARVERRFPDNQIGRAHV